MNAYREEVLEAAGRKARNWKRMGKSENREGIEFFELKITEFKATCLRNNLITIKVILYPICASNNPAGAPLSCQNPAFDCTRPKGKL